MVGGRQEVSGAENEAKAHTRCIRATYRPVSGYVTSPIAVFMPGPVSTWIRPPDLPRR